MIKAKFEIFGGPMTDEAKLNRLRALTKVPSYAARDHRLDLDENGKSRLINSLPRKLRRKAIADGRAIGRQYNEKIASMMGTGAGFPVDRLLRELALEYTQRYANSGTLTQPQNFNYFEPFCSIKLLPNSVAPYAEPATEMDHLFNLGDFFDYATGPESDGFKLASLSSMPEGKISHFTTNGDVQDLTFLTSDGREFVISGFSMVRHGNSIHWYALGGAVFDDEEWAELSNNGWKNLDPTNVPPWKRAFVNEVAERNNREAGPPVPLENTKTIQRTAISGEIDIITEKDLGRCFMAERKNTFDVVCDDPEVFDHITDKKVRAEFENMLAKRVDKTAALWLLAHTLIQLPAYFAFKLHVTTDVLVSAGTRSLSAPKSGRGLGGRYKIVTALDIADVGDLPVRQFTPPHYKTETGGHWRRLNNGAVGRDQHGDPVAGKTWVRKDSQWRDTGNSSRTIYVKSTISGAKLQISELLARASEIEQRQHEPSETGVLYVLRCLIMQEEVFKVGWTSGSAEGRAKELSSATGVPTSFVVVEKWAHEDPEALEKSVHAMLDPYRLNERREFFRLPYPKLKRIIEGEISRTSG